MLKEQSKGRNLSGRLRVRLVFRGSDPVFLWVGPGSTPPGSSTLTEGCTNTYYQAPSQNIRQYINKLLSLGAGIS